MIKIQRLTEDSSWHLQWDELSVIIDPWLVGSEIDGFNWLNEQWHVKDPVKISDLPDYDAIIISQSYEDHCHTPTIEKLDSTKKILAVPKAYKKLSKRFIKREITKIPQDDSITINQYKIRCFRPDKFLDPIYYALLITNEQGEGIFYSPHGFSLNEMNCDAVKHLKIKMLLTTFTEFDLPALLGGKVNPGLPNVRELSKQLQPEVVINTHDEEKVMKGIVAKAAKVSYADYQSLEKIREFNFHYIKDYQAVSFS